MYIWEMCCPSDVLQRLKLPPRYASAAAAPPGNRAGCHSEQVRCQFKGAIFVPLNCERVAKAGGELCIAIQRRREQVS